MKPALFSKTAWELIGWDDGEIRIKGGRATYQAVLYNCENESANVKLAKLVPAQSGFKEVSRYVHPDTVIEVLEDRRNEAVECPIGFHGGKQ